MLFYVGPYDLSSSLKITGKFNHPHFKKAIKLIIDINKKEKNYFRYSCFTNIDQRGKSTI